MTRTLSLVAIVLLAGFTVLVESQASDTTTVAATTTLPLTTTASASTATSTAVVSGASSASTNRASSLSTVVNSDATSASSGSTTASSSSPGTTPAPCIDDPSVNCESLKAQCSNPAYNDLMNKFCPKTCNTCGGCFDASANCANWANNGFCTNPFYTPEQRKDACAKTCNLC